MTRCNGVNRLLDIMALGQLQLLEELVIEHLHGQVGAGVGSDGHWVWAT